MPEETPPVTARFGSVRARLLLLTLLPMLVLMPLFIGAVALNWSARFDRLLIAKVNGELTIAHQYMTRILESSTDRLAALGASAIFEKNLHSPDTGFLDKQRAALGLDFLYLIRDDGKITSSPSVAPGYNPVRWPVVRQAMSGTRAATIDIFSAADLSAFDPDLAQRANIPLVPTEAAVPTTRTDETRGMVIHVAVPTAAGDPGMALVGGVLLNRNLQFIDTINDLVYPVASLTDGSRGTATLFLEDVRISTNVRLFENVRALGTRVSAIVRSRVLDTGETWLDRAFVVNDWYISAYEPIIDSFGNRVGMLYVGFLDTPFQSAKTRSFLTILAGFVFIALLSVPVFLRWAGGIIMPLERMVATIADVEQGNLGARSDVTGGQEEISRVAGHLDDLLDQLQERDRKLRDWADELNRRVTDRTRELSEANKRLEATTKQLIVSEKLAAIGEITAGVAHEINNPIAVIQGNIDVIKQETGAMSANLDTEFNLIYEQVHKVNTLVNKLLQFARPEEYAGCIEHLDPDDVARDCIPLVQHLMTKGDIALDLDLQTTGVVAINRTELQQVLINLVVNAIHAMPDGGALGIRSRDHDYDGAPGVNITVSDTGMGMPENVLAHIFDPFFSTKQGEGTGLGLSISQKLVTRCGGQISANSIPGQGSTFNVWIPAA
jgi:signal transduction histidine kinase